MSLKLLNNAARRCSSSAIWPSIAALITITLLVVLTLLDFGGLLQVPVFFLGVGLSFYFFLNAILWAFRKQWLISGGNAAAFLILIYAVGVPSLILGKSAVIAAYIYTQKNKTLIETTIAKQNLDANADQKLIYFPLGGSYLTPVNLVYDASDELLLPQEKRSTEWRTKNSNSEFAVCSHISKHVVDHLYLVNFAC